MLTELDTIDAVGRPSPGTVLLVINDFEPFDDDDAWLEALDRKLKVYVSYVLSEQFEEENPGVADDGVHIFVNSVFPLRASFKDVTELQVTSPKGSRTIHVSYRSTADVS